MLRALAFVLAVVCWTSNTLAQEKPLPPLRAPQPNPRHAIVPKPPPIAETPSLQQVIQALRRLPNGSKQLERARRSGAVVPTVASNADDSLRIVVAAGGPRVPDLVFGTTASVNAPPLLFAKVTRPANSVSVTGLGTLQAEAWYPAFATYDKVWGPLDRIYYGSCPPGGGCDLKSWVSISLNASTAGWYLINVMATPIAAEMRIFSGAAGYTLVTTFPYPTTSGYSSYPVLLHLGAGWHDLAWVNRDFFPYVSEVDVWKF
jgi:hypothetical protein